MIEFWQQRNAFMPASRGAVKWLLFANSEIAFIAGFDAAVLFLAATAGAMLLWRKDWRVPVMLILPIVLGMAASTTRHFAFANRMTVFTVPAVLILAGAGFGANFRSARIVRWLLMGVFCLTLYVPAKTELTRILHPEEVGDKNFRDTFLAVDHRGCSEHLFVHERAASDFRYYNRYRWGNRYKSPLVFTSQIAGGTADLKSRMAGYLAEAGDFEPVYFDNPPCFWLVVSYLTNNELRALHDAAAARGYQEVSAIKRKGSTAYFFESRSPAAGL